MVVDYDDLAGLRHHVTIHVLLADQAVVIPVDRRESAEALIFRWSEDGSYDYFVVRSATELGPALFREATEPVKLVTRVGAWWLYQHSHPSPSTTTTQQAK